MSNAEFISIDNILLQNDVYESEIIKLQNKMDTAVMSWNLVQDKIVQVTFLLRAKIDDKNFSNWFVMAEWGAYKNNSIKNKNTEQVKVDIDTFILQNPSDEWQFKIIDNTNEKIKTETTINSVSIAFKNSKNFLKFDNNLIITDKLDVPVFSQFEDCKDIVISKRICSPSSISMVAKYYGTHIFNIADTAKMVYDPNSEIAYGNWSFNVAVLFDLINSNNNIKTFVAFYESFDELLLNIKEKNPVMASISFKDGELDNAPLPTQGHILVITGADKDYVYVNDPAAKKASNVALKYKRTQFVKAWKGVAYIIKQR